MNRGTILLAFLAGAFAGELSTNNCASYTSMHVVVPYVSTG
jgi:hypothetical protein